MPEESRRYKEKADMATTKCMSDWWSNLTKEDILEIIADSPEVTADVLRQMLANEQVCLSLNTSFDTVTQLATVRIYGEA